MNFLAHYYFDRKEHPEYNLGLIIPDLFRNFVRGQRIKEQTLLKIQHTFHNTSIGYGALKHFKTDHLFHKSEPFKQGESLLLQQLRHSKKAFERDYFIAHILYELILDHALILEHPHLAQELYKDFETILREEVHAFLYTITLKDTSEKFNRGFNQFLEQRYLEKYVDADSIVYGLGRICNKMNISPFSEDQKLFLTHLVTQFRPIIVQDISNLEKWLEFKD